MKRFLPVFSIPFSSFYSRARTCTSSTDVTANYITTTTECAVLMHQERVYASGFFMFGIIPGEANDQLDFRFILIHEISCLAQDNSHFTELPIKNYTKKATQNILIPIEKSYSSVENTCWSDDLQEREISHEFNHFTR